MDSAIIGLIGLLGIIIGIVLNEYLRRTRRIEMYSTLIFKRRLNAYTKLYQILNESIPTINDILLNEDLTKEDRHSLASSVILRIADFFDKNALFIDDNLGAHCTALFMGSEDIYFIEDNEEKNKEIAKLINQYKSTKNMIIDDSGVSKVKKLFKKIQKTKLSSPTIDYLKKLKKEQGIND